MNGTQRSRRYQTMPPRAHCTHDCGWQDTGTGDITTTETEAITHADTTGHGTALIVASKILISPAMQEAGQ